MTKRIEGWGDKEYVFLMTKDRPFDDPAWNPAVLFIGENGDPPKVYTEKEVRKLLFAIDSAIMQHRAQQAIFHTAYKYGIDLTK